MRIFPLRIRPVSYDLFRWEIDGQPVIKISIDVKIFIGEISFTVLLKLFWNCMKAIPIRCYLRFAQTNLEILQPSEYSGGKGLGMNGTHRQHGIFLMYGTDIPKKQISKIEMWDIAPTLLYALMLKFFSYGRHNKNTSTAGSQDKIYKQI